jgi:tetratricopeptide (TPR) repeat protein
VIDAMEERSITNPDFIADLLNYQYGYIGYCIGIEEYDEAELYLEKAYTNLDFLIEKQYDKAVISSYTSALYGFEIGISSWKAPIVGPASLESAQNAISYDSSYYLGYVQYGHTQFYMPEVFGGSKKSALQNYHKAETLLEYNTRALVSDWNYLSLLVVIAQAYEKVDELQKAQTYYEKILRIEPDFLWVADTLYPQLLEKMK